MNPLQSKEDLILICRLRPSVDVSESALWKKKISELIQMVHIISDDEWKIIQQQHVRRQQYLSWSIDELKSYAQKLDVVYSGRTKGGIIDSILSANIEDIRPEGIYLDPDQQNILAHWTVDRMLISAGPGAGKTTTLCALTSYILLQNPMVRICILAYNRAAERVLVSRLRRFGVRPQNKDHITDTNVKGCFVLTFDKYGYYARGKHVSGNYRISLEHATERLVQIHEHWDYLIVDEAQDIKSIHSQLIDQIQPFVKHFIVAGDGRQELYTGAVWFSHLLTGSTQDKFYLRYNHRSCPEIVHFLNRFSRQHFPTLHHDQIPVRQTNGQVNFQVIQGDNVGNQIGQILLNFLPEQTYAISPVTIKKFRSESIINGIRQTIYDQRPDYHITLLGETIDGDLDTAASSYYVGNSFRVKGTERSTVVTFLADAPYQEYGISSTTSLKLIFVALSRARDNLYIILRDNPSSDSVFAGLTPDHIPICLAPTTIRTKPLFHIAVKEDLVNIESLPIPDIELVARFPVVKVPIQNDPDFVGIFTEVSLASALGHKLKNIAEIRTAEVMGSRLTESVGIFQKDNGTYTAVFNPLKDGQIDAIQQLRDIISESPEYIFSVIKMSSSIGRIWTVSEHLRLFKIDLGTLPEFLLNYLGKNSVHGNSIRMKIIAHRSHMIVGELHGEIDFLGRTCVEIKHANIDNLISHAIQLAIYITMLGHQNGLLVNTKYGQSFKVSTYESHQVSNICRAYLAMKHGTVASARLPKRIPLKPECDIYISVDIETVIIQGKTYLTEIGAIAFPVGSDRILSIFHQISGGLVVDLQDNMTGLRVIDPNEVQECFPLMITSFKIWYTQISIRRVFLCWAGSDTTILQCHDKSIDVYRLYCIWLEKIGQKRDINRTLSDAVYQILGPDEMFVPHRAFEDACLTAAVFIGLTSHDGTV